VARLYLSLGTTFDELLEAARCRGPVTNPLHRDRLARIYSAIACIRYSTMRELAKTAQGGQPSATMGGLAKLSWARAAQEMAELAMSILGPEALLGPWSKNLAMSPSMSIAGGTSDINRNIVGEHGLGLPR
jgi:alkylation response protein AidB-like acyl-CoA dehydrogenase